MDETIFQKEEISNILFLITKIVEEKKRPEILKELFSKKEKKPEFSRSTISRALNFYNHPSNINLEVFDLITLVAFNKKSIKSYIYINNSDYVDFQNSEVYISFFVKWDQTEFHIGTDSYNFPLKKVSEYLQAKNMHEKESDVNINFETHPIKSQIVYLRSFEDQLNKNKIIDILDKEYYFEIKEYIHFFRDTVAKPILINIVLEKIEELEIALRKHEIPDSFFDKLKQLFEKEYTKRGIIKSIQKEYKIKLQKLYKEESR